MTDYLKYNAPHKNDQNQHILEDFPYVLEKNKERTGSKFKYGIQFLQYIRLITSQEIVCLAFYRSETLYFTFDVKYICFRTRLQVFKNIQSLKSHPPCVIL